MKIKKHILMLLSNGFEPDPRVHKEAKSLIEHDYEVTIICWDRHQELKKEEILDNIQIIRIRTGNVKSGNILSMLKHLPRFHKKAYDEAKKIKFDAIHCHDFDTMSTGCKLKNKYKKPLVYDIHDLYESHVAKIKLAKYVVKQLDKYYCKKANRIIIVNNSFKNEKQIKGKKTTLIMNTPLNEGEGISKDKKEGIFYAGGLYAQREMSFIFDANKELKEKITIAGNGPLLEKYKKQYQNKNNIFLGRISPKDVEERTKNCKIIIAPYDTSYPNNKLASPNKLFEAMKYGKPSLVSDGTVMGNIVKEENCGETFKYGDKKEFIKKFKLVEKNYSEYSKKANKAFNKKYSWNIATQNLVKMYEEIL